MSYQLQINTTGNQLQLQTLSHELWFEKTRLLAIYMQLSPITFPIVAQRDMALSFLDTEGLTPIFLYGDTNTRFPEAGLWVPFSCPTLQNILITIYQSLCFRERNKPQFDELQQAASAYFNALRQFNLFLSTPNFYNRTTFEEYYRLTWVP
jgi:hypothetical protein